MVVTAATAEAMAEAIRHRGPDDGGAWADPSGQVSLGNRRLAIIDLSPAGHMPMLDEERALALTYNGELYNYRELRSALETRGYTFRSRTDTEVVLRSYAEWGQACVERFNGMFAFALWDGSRRALLLARDKYGVKPLYYAFRNGLFYFGSEVKALLAAWDARPEVDHLALAEYFTFQNIFSDRTLFAGVQLLPAGHTLVAADGRVETRRYWDFRFYADSDRGERYYAAGVRERFEAGIQRQLMSDVPLGSYLSGGMDSGSICAVAGRALPQLTTFTGGFDVSDAVGAEAAFDERAEAELMATSIGVEHYQMLIQPQDMARVLPQLVWHLEDLRVGSSYHNYYMAQLASRFVKVVLAGAGGDELFAGYPWRYAVLDRCSDPAAFNTSYYRFWAQLVPEAERNAFFSDAALHAIGDYQPFDAFAAVADAAVCDDLLHRALYFEAKTFLHGLFIVEDKLSMAHSLESRVPFLDDDLVEFVGQMPSHYKLRDGTGKHILRRAMRGLIPDRILAARKQGFAPPEDSWFRSGALPYIRKVLLSPQSLARPYFRPGAVPRIVEEHASGVRNHKKLIWSLLCFEWWNRIFIDGERPVSMGRRVNGTMNRLPH